MLSIRLVAITALTLVACGQPAEEAKIIGVWQCNPRNGKVWRMTFTPDHKIVMSLPHDETVDANLREAKFDEAFSGIWRIERDELVYTIEDKEHDIPKTTTRMKLAEFKNAAAFGTDREAYLQRL
jgi:hypothetical protein